MTWTAVRSNFVGISLDFAITGDNNGYRNENRIIMSATKL